MPSVLRDWVQNLSYCKQGVLMGAIRGCDGVNPEGPHKVLTRGIRMYCLKSGKTTGTFNAVPPTSNQLKAAVAELTDKFYDQLPVHFFLHLIFAMEVIGYDHPNLNERRLWHYLYVTCVKAMHLNYEPHYIYDARLSDDENSEAGEAR